MTNLLKRGVDPYADAVVTDMRTGQIPFEYNATEWAAGGYKYLPNAYKGRIRELVAVVQATNDADCVLSVIMGTETLGSVTVPSGAVAGSRHMVAIADDADDFNQVDVNDVVTVLADGVPTTGSIRAYVRVSADA